MSLTDLHIIREIELHSSIGCIFYSEINDTLLCQDYIGNVMKIYNNCKVMHNLQNLTNLEVVQTNASSHFLLDYPEKNLFFSGGEGGLVAIDYTHKQIVAKFQVKG